MDHQVVNLAQKLSLFSEHWEPKIVGELNGQYVKLAKLHGEFTWHKHDEEDELFYVISGTLMIEFRDRTETIQPGEFLIVPKGEEHKPVAPEEVCAMLFEPKGTVNTGNQENEMTHENLQWL